jgi:hypothetical protein
MLLHVIMAIIHMMSPGVPVHIPACPPPPAQFCPGGGGLIMT